jgi:hypothetical protein
LRSTTFAVFVLAGCGVSLDDPSLDELNAVQAVPDSRIDSTPADAPFAAGQMRDVGDADAVYVSSLPNEFVSGAVMPGDLDGDGYDDLVLWAHRSNDPDIVDCSAGCPGFSQLAVHIDYGGPTLSAEIVPDATIESWHVAGLESWVAAGGDVDGDGRPDLLLSVGGECQQGNVFTLHGGPRLSGTMDVRDVSGVIRETGACTGFGTAIGLGDLDADGIDDFAIAARASGRTYLFYGRAERALERRDEAHADAVLTADIERGIGPAQPAGDVNGDGFDDLIVSHAPDGNYEERPAEWFVVLGGARLTGEVSAAAIGTRLDAAMVRGLGDLDGDGYAELGVTRNASGIDAYVLAGRAEWPDALGPDDGALRIERAPGASPFGATALRPAGDVDGNGALDFLYTDADASADEFPRGEVHLFLGPRSLADDTLALDAGATLLGQLWLSEHDGSTRGFDELGNWSWEIGDGLAAGTDLDGDGLDDMAIVAMNAPNYGRVYVWRGRR